MLIKDLIQVLETSYNSYDDEYKAMMGEPEIMIDVFAKNADNPKVFDYRGFHNKIVIEKSRDGVYDIMSAFLDTYNELHQIEEPKASQPFDSPLPGQEER